MLEGEAPSAEGGEPQNGENGSQGIWVGDQAVGYSFLFRGVGVPGKVCVTRLT